jgi:hypothetical protein
LRHYRSGYRRENRYAEGIITAIAFGGFLVIIGVLFALTPNLWQNITAFFGNLTTAAFPFGGPNSTISLIAPANPAAHKALYTSLLQFDVAFGILQIVILALRIQIRSQIRRIAEAVGNAVFWIGAVFMVNTFLLLGTLTSWFQYWGALIVIVGVSMVARAIVYLSAKSWTEQRSGK